MVKLMRADTDNGASMGRNIDLVLLAAYLKGAGHALFRGAGKRCLAAYRRHRQLIFRGP
jgi:hypothetical protein